MYIMWYNTKQLCKNAKNRRGDFMLNIYKTDLETNDFKKIKEFKPGSWISLINPTDEEIAMVCSELDISDEFIRYPLDYEEQARIDIDDDMTLFVVDVPIIEDDS